jgi:AraC-like DNA-binding protein
MNIIQFIGISALFQTSIFILYLLFSKEKNRYNNIFLALLLSTLAVLTLISIVLASDGFTAYYKSAEIGNQAAFLFGPLYLWYFQSFFDTNFKFKPLYLIFFTPFLFAVIFYSLIKYDVILMTQDKIIETVIRLIETVQNFIFLAIVFFSLKRHRLKTFPADVFRVIWLVFISAGSIVILALRFIFFVVCNMTDNQNWCEYTMILYFLTSFLFFNTIFFIFLIKPGILLNKKKYENSLLNDSDKERLKISIIGYMSENRSYLAPDISLDSMAENLSISSKYLSQVLNEVFNRNFFDFINSYRIEECKKLLLDKSNKKTILEILYETGFNSKSSFNNAFKKYTGMTPKEFRLNNK